MNNPTPGADDPDLLVAVQALSNKVADLTAHLTVSQDQAARIERQAQRTKALTRVVLVLVTISLVGVFVTALLLQKVDEAVDGNQANAVTNCQNANESRRGSKQLWDFIINTSISNGKQTPESVEILGKLQEYVAAIYEPRDCSDLGRKYPLPDPPTLTQD